MGKAAIFVVIIIILAPCIVCAEEVLVCSDAIVRIDFVISSMSKHGVETVLKVSRGNRSTILRYDMGIDYIGVECRKNKDKKPYIIFQAFCGGSGCHDRSNYGIIDPKDLRVLLVPNDWNHKDVEAIFGGQVRPIEKVLSIHKAALKLGIGWR